jgi:hypothetical protein
VAVAVTGGGSVGVSSSGSTSRGENVLFGHYLHDPSHATMSESDKGQAVQQALEQVLLWDNVKDKLKGLAISLSLEEQQTPSTPRARPPSKTCCGRSRSATRSSS